MKTTLEIPDDLYREVKAAAALRRVPVKDMVAQGLRKLLEDQRQSGRDGVLDALRDLRKHSNYTPDQIREMTQEAYRTRRDGWERNAG